MLTNVARRAGFLLLLILAACGAVLIAKQELAPDLHVGWESDGLKISFHPEERRNNTWFEYEPFYTGARRLSEGVWIRSQRPCRDRAGNRPMLHRLQRPFEVVYANSRGVAVQSGSALDASAPD